MQSLPVEVGSSSSSAPSDTSGPVVKVSFPSAQTSVLDSLNRQREDGRLCDLSIHVQGQVFKAHRCVLAASSPYFHDQMKLSVQESTVARLQSTLRASEEEVRSLQDTVTQQKELHAGEMERRCLHNTIQELKVLGMILVANRNRSTGHQRGACGPRRL